MSTDTNPRASGDERRTFIEHLARHFTLRQLIFAITLSFFIISILFPFYWMISSSFKTYAEIGGREPVYIPSALRLQAYRELLDPSSPRYQRFGINIVNSLQISVTTGLIAVILSVLGAYAVTRLRFRGREAMLNSILLVYLFPGILLIIPLFAMLSQVGAAAGFEVRDNLGVLTFTYLAQTLPVALYMLANYFRTIPLEIEEAALIDGCTRLSVIWRVTVPLSLPALITVFIYTFMIAWNEYLYAYVFLNERSMFTMPIAIDRLFNDPQPRPHVVMAASTIATLPVIALFLALEKYLAEGLVAGGVKG